MIIVYDECSFDNNTLKREIFYRSSENNLIKIEVKRNCNNSYSNITVSLLDINKINKIELLFKESGMLINKDLTCYSDDNLNKQEIVNKNNEDIDKILDELERIGIK